jgi:hypothetical protein
VKVGNANRALLGGPSTSPYGTMSRIVLLVAVMLVHAIARADAAEHCPVLPSDVKVQWTYVRGPDFDICYVKRPNSDVQLFGVYLGNFPGFHTESAKKIGLGNIGGRDVTWFAPPADANVGPFSRQTVLSLGTKYPSMTHVWILADTQSELQQTLQILERLRFRDVVAP